MVKTISACSRIFLQCALYLAISNSLNDRTPDDGTRIFVMVHIIHAWIITYNGSSLCSAVRVVIQQYIPFLVMGLTLV
jgi:hypothetical protein